MNPWLVLLVLINLNTATLEELDALPGVGPVLASRIMRFRERRGGFRRIEELLAIPGISEARWQVLRKLVVVEPEESGEARTDGAEVGVTDPSAVPKGPVREAEPNR